MAVLFNSQILKQNFPKPAKFKRNYSLVRRPINSSTRGKNNSQSNSFDITPSNPFSIFPIEIPKISRLIYRSPCQKRTQTVVVEKGSASISEPERALPKICHKAVSKKITAIEEVPRETGHFLPSKSEFSERVYWNKRVLGDMPLVIIVFEGVIGDFARRSLWENKGTDMLMCPGWANGLKSLSQHSYIALISAFPLENLNFLQDFFLHNGVGLDAIYRKTSQPRHLQNFSQIFSDFLNYKAIILSSVGIDRNELESRQGMDLIYEKSMSSHKKIICNMCPTDKNSMVLLFPNPRAQVNDQAMLFTEIVDFLTPALNAKDPFTYFLEISEKKVLKKFKFSETTDVFVHSGKNMQRRSCLYLNSSHLKVEIELHKVLKKRSETN